MMDCATTGIEPDIALVKYKTLAGGGTLKMVNMTVPGALRNLGYSKMAVDSTVAHIGATGTIEGAPQLKVEHLAVFDCALKPASGKRVIPYRAHIEMMAAAQPFISGAISKTVNMPAEVTIQEIASTYSLAWHLGLKCVAVYRDGSKRSQPVSTKKNQDEPHKGSIEGLKAEIEGLKAKLSSPKRKKMPATRQSITHKFSIAGHEGYLTVGLFPDGKPGELFITMSKEGSTVGGLMDCVGTLTSLALQYGVPLETLASKFSHVRFEPSGFTNDNQIRSASSIIDYVFRWLEAQFLVKEDPKKEHKKEDPRKESDQPTAALMTVDAPPCPNCGHITVRNGSCHKCLNCGESLGCS
jgi:ribonucleoside-diphosphate reductase alpha chain